MITEGNFFLLVIKTMHCDPSSELFRQDSSDEGSQPMFLCRINKNYHQNTPSYLELWLVSDLTLKAPITTEADDIHEYFFIVFQRI